MRLRLRFLFVVVVLALAPAAAAAPLAEHTDDPNASDDAADARAHYEAAQQLYDEGKYEEAIAEFEIAYHKKPHPNVLYNIGQAQERLLDYGASVRAFERYLAEAAPDDPRRKIVENRLRVLRGLPARVSVTTIPEHVHARIVGQDGATVDQADTPHQFSIPAGDYTLVLEQTGLDTERVAIHADIGQPYFYQYRLQRTTAEAFIESVPSGARVFVDERLVGETPYHSRLELGKHSLLLEYPDYPWHRERLRVDSGETVHRVVRLERPPRSGRTELVIGAMAFGGITGPLLVGALAGSTQFTQSGSGIATLLASSAAGIGAGFLGAFLSTRNGLPVGQSSVLIGGGAFGTGMGAALALGLNGSQRSIYGITLLGGAVGVGTATLIASLGRVSAGDAALANSGGIWGTAGAALLAQSIPIHGERPGLSTTSWFVLGGAALGLTAGVLSAKFLERTRTEVAIVDLGGFIGTALGFALGYGVGANSKSADAVQDGSRFALPGMAVGLVAGAFVSRSFMKRKLRVAPLHAGSAIFGMPSLRIEPVRGPTGEVTRVSLDVFTGRW